MQSLMEGEFKQESERLYSILDDSTIDDEGVVEGDELIRTPHFKMLEPAHRLTGALICVKDGLKNYGTGMLISKNLVLSCAHNIVNRQRKIKLDQKILFYPGQQGPLQDYYEVENYYLPLEYGQYQKNFRQFDYAILKLKRPVKENKFIELSGDLRGIEKATLSIYGYPKIKYECLAASPNTQGHQKQNAYQYGLTRTGYVIEAFSKIGFMFHKISTLHGQSGAAIIRTDSDGHQSIVGIHLFNITEKEEFQRIYPSLEKVNGAILFTQNIIKRLKNYAQTLNGQPFEVSPIYQNVVLRLIGQLKIVSHILTQHSITTPDLKFINNALGHPSSFQLIFRASEHDFSAKAFHDHCDKASDTFIVVRTEFGKILCAYSHYKWGFKVKPKQKNSSEKVYDSDRRAFILSIGQNIKLVPHLNVCIRRSENWGPCFGQMGALDICDKCDKQSKSQTWGIGGSFNTVEPEKRFQYKLKNTSLAMNGGTQQHHTFRVKEYEVFKLGWDRDEDRQHFFESFGKDKKIVEDDFQARTKMNNKLTWWEDNHKKSLDSD